MKLNKQFPFLLIIIATLGACKKDRSEVIVPPGLLEPLENNGKDTLSVGESLRLHPKLNGNQNTTYTWMINGQPSGTDSVFAFNPTARGDFKIDFKATNVSGEVVAAYNLHVLGKYENGFFVVNEGWFGHGTGTVSFYRYDTKKMEDSLFTKENPGKDIEPKTSTLESGVLFGDKFYLISKVGGPMVVTDKYSLKETARIPSQGGNDWRSFVGISMDKGLISAQSGLYPINLNTLQISTKLAGVTGQIGDLLKAGNYVFALSATQGVVIINATTNAVEKTISGVVVGFTQTPDGAVWAAGGTKLYKIDPESLTIQSYDSPFSIFGSWAAWHPGSITASKKENAVFIARNGSFSGGTQVYKYIPGDASSLQTPFITLPAGKILYGSGIAFDNKLNQVILNTVQSGFGDNFRVNNMYFHDATTSTLKDTYTYDGFYFPSIMVPHQ